MLKGTVFNPNSNRVRVQNSNRIRVHKLGLFIEFQLEFDATSIVDRIDFLYDVRLNFYTEIS